MIKALLIKEIGIFIGGSMITILGWVFKDLISVNIKPVLERYGKVDYSKINKKRKYFNNLYSELSKMPFILHDFELDIESNYVDVVDKKIDISTLQIDEKNDNYGDYSIKPFVLILGNAGIGKTTFTRNVILKIIKSKDKILDYEKKELKSVIPIYVPLKIVNNSVKSPIINYILENNLYYKKNEKKIVSDLRSRKIFLFLDGYDEISTVANRNYIKDELELILGSGTYTYTLRYDDKFKDIYESFYLSKVWLTSRKEFYKSNLPIPLKHFFKYKENIVGLALEGVNDERLKLVNTLFEKYKQSNPKLKDLLSAELFINEINESQDNELIDLSKVPLFLTVMSYIYINDVRETGDIKINFLSDYYTLINKFIELLLIELDEEKVKSQTRGMKNAYLTRRNNLTDEKLQFIKYFAFKNYDNNLNTFNIDALRESAKIFFEHNKQIHENLISTDKKDIIDEIINNGIFSYIGNKNDIDQYDFPHRKFKEVLGVQFIIDQKDTSFIINELLKGESYELGFEYLKKIDNKRDFIKSIINNIQYKNKSENICLFINEYCLNDKYEKKLIISEIEIKLINLVTDGKAFYISEELYKNLDFSDSYYNFLIKHIAEANKIDSKIPYIALLYNSNKVLEHKEFLENKEIASIHAFLEYIKKKEIVVDNFINQPEKLKNFILSIIVYNKMNIDTNIFENCFLKIHMIYLTSLLKTDFKFFNNQYKIFDIYKKDNNPTINDLIFDIEQVILKNTDDNQKLPEYLQYFLQLYHIESDCPSSYLVDQLSNLKTINIVEIEKVLMQNNTKLKNNISVDTNYYNDINTVDMNFKIF